MKYLYTFLVISSLIFIGCSKDGALGPVGDAGKAGAVGAVGDKGAIGDKGVTGAPGMATNTNGVSNLVVSGWKKGTWKFTNVINDVRYFEGEVAFSEITDDVINKGLIRTYSRVNGVADKLGLEEFPNGITSRVSNSSLSMIQTIKGYKSGKLLIQGKVTSSLSNDDVSKNLNVLSLEFRINIIK
jgi:hypothetical protein